MGEEGREELELEIFKENSSAVEDGEVREEELLDSGGSNKIVNEGESKEQEELREQIQVQDRIQVLLCFLLLIKQFCHKPKS